MTLKCRQLGFHIDLNRHLHVQYLVLFYLPDLETWFGIQKNHHLLRHNWYFYAISNHISSALL